MALHPYAGLSVADHSHYPQTTLPDVRDRVRNGEDLAIDFSHQMPIHFHRQDVLHIMREFSLKDILVKEGDSYVARVEPPSPSPFPEHSDAILRQCAAHIAAIRSKSDALLQAAHALVSPELFYIERMANAPAYYAVVQQLAEIERQCCSIRDTYEMIFCDAYIHDTFFDDEAYERMEEDIDAALAQQEETIIALQQHL